MKNMEYVGVIVSRYIMVNTERISEIDNKTCSHSYKNRANTNLVVRCTKRTYQDTLCKEHHYYQQKRLSK
jgi:hypothetical protein